MPEIFTGYVDEVNKMMGGIQDGVRFSLLVGPTGSGKTTLLKNIEKKLGDKVRLIYLPKPPNDPKDLIDIFATNLRGGFLEKLSTRELNLYNLGDFINKKVGGEKIIFLIDEAQEASQQTLEWLRALSDQIENISIVMAGLPQFEKNLKDNLETLLRRVTLKVELGNLNKSEVKELIKRRVENSGGSDTRPFTDDCINFIYEKTAGFPREVLRVCDQLVQKAASKNLTIIDKDFLDVEENTAQRTSTQVLEELPERQKQVLDILSKNTALTPTELAAKVEMNEYKSKDNAIRALNNILIRLMKDNLIIRKKIGKAYKYEVAPKTQSLLVTA
ncbi:MAG TPA: AAA family ATPase [archaeon]|nr:AAA family ATPase [archaeon]